jgi:hypothetical protein
MLQIKTQSFYCSLKFLEMNAVVLQHSSDPIQFFKNPWQTVLGMKASLDYSHYRNKGLKHFAFEMTENERDL